jgi:hypothetical protein
MYWEYKLKQYHSPVVADRFTFEHVFDADFDFRRWHNVIFVIIVVFRIFVVQVGIDNFALLLLRGRQPNLFFCHLLTTELSVEKFLRLLHVPAPSDERVDGKVVRESHFHERIHSLH